MGLEVPNTSQLLCNHSGEDMQPVIIYENFREDLSGGSGHIFGNSQTMS
jgi:hypothetical protein